MFCPFYEQVLVRKVDRGEHVSNGIIIPGNVSSRLWEGEVLAHGSGRLMANGTIVKASVKKGDIAVFHAEVGYEITDKEYGKCLIIRETDILGILK